MYSSQLYKSSLFGMSNLYLSNDPNIIQLDYILSPTLLVLPKSSQKDQDQVQEEEQLKMETQSEDNETNLTLPSNSPSPCSSSSSQDHDATKKPEVVKTNTTHSNGEAQDTTNIHITLPPPSFPSSSSSSSSSSSFSSCNFQHQDETKDREDERVQSKVKYGHSVLLKREFNEMFLEIEDGYQTPTSPSHRIPRVTACPPPPRKAHRRRVMNKRSCIEFMSVDEIGDNFSPLRKKAREESAIAN